MVVATGFFDGVHLGHRAILEALVSEAARRGTGSVAVSFWPHPRTVLQDSARNLRLLSSLGEKEALVRGTGVERFEVLPFTDEFSRMTASEYVRNVLKERFGADAVVLGYDNRLGGGGESHADVVEIIRAEGLDIITPEPVYVGGVAVSSSKIRTMLSCGDIASASACLGRLYSLEGVVVSGNRLGRTIGFPTANIRLYEPLKLIPGGGVYAVWVETAGGKYLGMCNIGSRPTVGGSYVTIEVNIFGFDREIYGRDIRLSLISRIRDEKRFESLSQLRLQLEKDRDYCLSNF